MNPGVIIPTLNEADNIGTLIGRIKEFYRGINIVVVDDNSVDGTPGIIKELMEKYDGIHLVNREKRKGIGAAIVNGFEYCLKCHFDPIITMDGDLSHDPVYIKDFFKYIGDFDLVLGSRYISGVRVEGWRFRKLLISKLANMFVAYLLIKPIWDFTSGYRCYSANFLNKLDLSSIPTEGYLFQIHMVY
ncbi:MAG: glycosyltransferase, partial [Calditrichia bacterium]